MECPDKDNCAEILKASVTAGGLLGSERIGK